MRYTRLTIVVLASSVSAQSFAGLPSCALTPVLNAISSSGCSTNDLPCICNSSSFTGSLSQALIEACSADDLQKTAQTIAGLCSEAAVSTGKSVVASSTALPTPVNTVVATSSQIGAASKTVVATSANVTPVTSPTPAPTAISQSTTSTALSAISAGNGVTTTVSNVTPPTFTSPSGSVSTDTSTSTSTTAPSSSPLSTGAKIGIGVGCAFLALFIIGFAAYYILRLRHRGAGGTGRGGESGIPELAAGDNEQVPEQSAADEEKQSMAAAELRGNPVSELGLGNTKAGSAPATTTRTFSINHGHAYELS